MFFYQFPYKTKHADLTFSYTFKYIVMQLNKNILIIYCIHMYTGEIHFTYT